MEIRTIVGDRVSFLIGTIKYRSVQNIRYVFLLMLGLGLILSCQGPKSDDHLISDDANWSEEGDFDDKVSTYEDENRDIWQQPDRVLDLLGPIENSTVVDLGAGSGYFSFRLVARAGKVIAVEIDPEFVSFLDRKRAQLPSGLQSKFETRLATADDPKLMDGEADAILLVSTYAYMTDRVRYFSELKSKLSERGKIVIIEFKTKDIPNGPPAEEKVSLSTVEKELKEAGYDQLEIDDQTLDYQYIIIARP